MKAMKFFIIIIIILAIAGVGAFFFKLCPPSGPWPAPPWCGRSIVNHAPATDFEISKPQYPGSRSAFAFPPSCDILPDAIAKSVCQEYKSGSVIFWQESACDALPFAPSKDMCKQERAELKKIGEKNAVSLRKANADWWKRPDLNVYVYGDTRLRTEELRPDVSVWGGGSYNGWRADEIFMTHAIGTIKVVSHSFGYIGQNDLDYMRSELMKEEGIVLSGPADLSKPEVVKINNDLEYLKSKSKIFQTIIPAIAKNFDNTDAMVVYTFPNGSKKVSNISLSPIVPAYKDYLIKYYKWQVDANADGMFIDDMVGANPATSFNPLVLQKFNAWLMANADKATISKYNIAADFNYRDFLARAGYTRATIDNTVGKTIGANDSWRSIPLMIEFRKFLISEQQQVLIDIVTEVKAYAKSKGRTDFIATGNAGELAPGGAFAAPYFDYLTFEHAYIRNDNPLAYQSVLPVTKLAFARERPAANQILVDNWDPLVRKTSESLRMNILKLAVMESYAGGSGTSYVRYSANDPRAQSDDMAAIYSALDNRFDLQEIQLAYGFMRHYKQYFKDFTNSTAKVAVILDNNEVIREWKADITADHQYSAEDIGKNLEAAGIAYDVINWDQLNARAGSNQYGYVILPRFKSIGKNYSAAIAKARSNGIKIISVGGNLKELSGLSDISSSENSVASAIKSSVPILRLPAGMKAVVKADSKGNYIAHLLNYDYDAAGFKEKKNIALDVNFFGGAKKILYASLENNNLIELDPAKPIIPSVTTYGILIIEK